MLTLKLIVIGLLCLVVALIVYTVHSFKRAKKCATERRILLRQISSKAIDLRNRSFYANSVYELEQMYGEACLLMFLYGKDDEMRSELSEAQWRIRQALRDISRGWEEKPYATEHELTRACTVLGADPSVTNDAIMRAYQRTVAPYNLGVLRKKNPPKGVIETARKRRIEAYMALRLLRGFKRFHT
ncbi:MAG: hypothetical protein CMF62_11410 [Magnetococcales bacterium]|nr:hypothetical protein [Magnetococcales bacterium]